MKLAFSVLLGALACHALSAHSVVTRFGSDTGFVDLAANPNFIVGAASSRLNSVDNDSPVLAEFPAIDISGKTDSLVLTGTLWEANPATDFTISLHDANSRHVTYAGNWSAFSIGAETSVTLFLNGTQPGDFDAAKVRYLTISFGGAGAGLNFTFNELSVAGIDVTAPAEVPATAPGGSVELTVPHRSPNANYQWQRNGSVLLNANDSSLTLDNLQPPFAGLYTYTATASGGAGGTSDPVIVGLKTSEKIVGAGTEVATDILHPNGNTYDQVLLNGPAATITANPSQITRISFVDFSGDIVQVEFTGAGTLSLVLDGASTPRPAANYNQPGVAYVVGHAGLVITGADETSNVTVFSVGRLTAIDPTLFKAEAAYDGVANLSFIAIQSANGKFGGIRTGNVHFYAYRGFTGIYAPGVEFVGPVNVGDITAFESAAPLLVFGAAEAVRIAGGNMGQDNGVAVKVSGIEKIQFADGETSHGDRVPAQANAAVYIDDGVDVTDSIVVNP